MGNGWQLLDAYGTVGFVLSGERLPSRATPIEANAAAREVTEWFASEEPGGGLELLVEMCAEATGTTALDPAREVDLLRERVRELLEAKTIVAFRMPPPKATDPPPEAKLGKKGKASEPPPKKKSDPPPPEKKQKDDKPCCTIKSLTVATSPAKRTRTKIGVGEEVDLTVDPGPATWAITSGGGKLSPAGSQTTVRFTASDKAEKVVVTATGAGCSCTITLEVVRPSGWTMKRKAKTALRHSANRPTTGWLGIMYVHPNDVNFYRVETREKDSSYTGTGSYKGYNGSKHGSYPAPDYASEWFLLNAHTEADGTTDNAPDQIYTGDPGPKVTGAKPPFVEGKGSFPITIQWRIVGEKSIFDFAAVTQSDEIVATGVCKSVKGGHPEKTNWDDPASSWDDST